MREKNEDCLIKKTKEALEGELAGALLTEEDLEGFKKAALKRPPAVRWRQFLERETRISITAAAACLLVVISVGGYAAGFFLRMDQAPAEPLIIHENGHHAGSDAVPGGEV